MTDVENLHLTLAFLGNVENQQIACLFDIAERICTVRFDLKLDLVIRKLQSNMIWLTTDQSPVELISLVDALRLELQANGFRTDDRPFKAHITLARKLRSSVVPFGIRPILWSIGAISLIESKNDVNGLSYLQLRSWSLANNDT